MAVSSLSPTMAPVSSTSLSSRAAPSSSSTLLGSFNPLHHIPVVSTIYDEITSTRALPAIRIMVAGALAGPLGFVAALADALLEEATGRTTGGHIVAALTDAPEIAMAPTQSSTDIRLSSHEKPGADPHPTGSTGDRGAAATAMAVPDGRTTREVARAYLLELALHHSVRPAEDNGEAARV